jgi:hypothetical protein
MPNGQPKQDGSGGGTRSNRGRGGCGTTRSTGQGRNPKK